MEGTQNYSVKNCYAIADLALSAVQIVALVNPGTTTIFLGMQACALQKGIGGAAALCGLFYGAVLRYEGDTEASLDAWKFAAFCGISSVLRAKFVGKMIKATSFNFYPHIMIYPNPRRFHLLTTAAYMLIPYDIFTKIVNRGWPTTVKSEKIENFISTATMCCAAVVDQCVSKVSGLFSRAA